MTEPVEPCDEGGEAPCLAHLVEPDEPLGAEGDDDPEERAAGGVGPSR